MKQIFANNAKTTLANSLAINGTAIVVADASTFPTPSTYQYFLCTLELNGAIEVLMITGRTGNTLTIGGALEPGETVPGRGQEGSISKAFAAGARVECRVTKNTLARLSTSMQQITSVENILAPKDSYYEGYVASSFDPFGNPVIAVKKDEFTWKFPNFSNTNSLTATAATTTSVTASVISLPTIVSGKYIVQFTSGTETGKIRVITSYSAGVISWNTPLANAPLAGDTFEVLKSNASILFDVLSIGDDAVIMPLLLGGDS